MTKDQFWQMGLSEGDKETSQDAAGPDRPHDYCWYVIEHLNRGEVRRDCQLPLEEAVRLYAGLDSAGKRLGVTKDGIDSVDLAVSLNGQEWLCDDWQRLDSFARDPVVAGAAELIRQTLEEQAVGRISFANGEQISFSDPQKYIEAIREELPYHPTTGFRCETLTSDPAVRKAVDAELYDLYGMEPEEDPVPSMGEMNL